MWGQGVPDKRIFNRLQYNEHAGFLIASFRSKGSDGQTIEESYYRHKNESRYTRLDVGDSHNIRHVCTCSDAPIVILNVWQRLTSPRKGYNWDSIKAFNLISKNMTTVVTIDSIKIPRVLDRWIASILSVNSDGTKLTVVLASESGGVETTRVKYQVCNLDTVNMQLDRLALLPDVYF